MSALVDFLNAGVAFIIEQRVISPMERTQQPPPV